MILKIFLIVFFSAAYINAHAENLPANLVGTWSEWSHEAAPDSVVINQNKNMTYTMKRQVGYPLGDISYPSMCYYKQSGEITTVVIDQNDMDITYIIRHVELIHPIGNTPPENCARFIENENASLPRTVTWKITFLNSKTIMDKWFQNILNKTSF